MPSSDHLAPTAAATIRATGATTHHGEHLDRPARTISRDRLGRFAIHRSLWPFASVIAAYLLAAIMLPTMANVGISDDWTYARSVEYLVNQGRFHILSVAAATQIFQLFWGASFALVFGMDFGALRLSTIVIVLISGLAMYGLCRELRVSRTRSAIGMAVYLFNPVLFPITYSFMSDPQFLALVVIASYWYLRGLRAGVEGETAIWLGSAVAALSCLQRPHGALIPLGVATYFFASGQLRVDSRSARLLLRIGLLPALTLALIYFVISAGIPSQQDLFLSQVESASWQETWLLLRRLTHIEMAYLGLFVLPIVIGVLGSLGSIVDLRQRRSWLVFGLWQSLLVAGLVWFWGEGRRMPYVPHFLGRGGPGSADLRAAKPPLAAPWVYDVATIICVFSALVFGAALIRRLEQGGAEARAGAGLLLGIAVWQAIGVVPQSFLFRNWIISLDRYVLPILPFSIALLLWSLNDRTIRAPTAWFATALIALFSVIGTRDALTFQQDVWDLAKQLNTAGVVNTRLDAGYAWDAYHLWEYGEENDIPRRTPDGTWWTDVYAKPTDSTYVIAGGPLAGYDVLSVQPYSAWLQREPVALYVLRRTGTPPDGVAWPPPVNR